MKNTSKKTFLVFLIMIIVLYFILKDDYKAIINNILIADKKYLLFGILLMSLYYVLKSVCMYLLSKEYKKDVTFKEMLNHFLITQFFNGITPFSTGGQPAQIYMLRKSGIKVANATSITISDFLIYQIALIAVGFTSLIINGIFKLINIDKVLLTLIVIGFILNILIGVFLVLISFSKKFNNFIGRIVLKIISKIKLIKNREALIDKLKDKLNEFNEGSKIIRKDKGLLVKCFLLNYVALLSYYMVAFFIFRSLDSNTGITLIISIIVSSFVLLIGAFVPIPGGSGGIEGAFLTIFAYLVSGSIIKSALIMWRFITYYLCVLVGGILLSINGGVIKK